MEYFKDQRSFKDLYHVLSLPFIWGVLPFLFILDVVIEIYHHACFALYGLEYVDRKQYIRIDRQKLSYLENWQKINCMYCGYANGLFNYWVMIAAETESYWCGIQHKPGQNFIPPKHHKNFTKYDDQKEFLRKYKK
ncbi:hypothetical protein H6761_04010 [Candidatus Nomurabacteria bacterium]|nr:hypothetical protein [Candidatus Nomurabacteria bacterium]